MSEQLDVTEKRYVSWGGSWGNTEPEEKEMKITAWANKERGRGGFEVYDTETSGDNYYGEGGLWFSDEGYLEDYDGVGSLDGGILIWLGGLGMISPDPDNYFRERLKKLTETGED
ncbi:MAG: hypothetical protein CMC15_13900 [Flavobacteriaceae bacterium]|nr:hypothetical protein [Flavobacteriaceae bacterium]|tara:strand:- start:124 stop:468 length:345 start_codon:yes stop_codon:yes gene_type:complete